MNSSLSPKELSAGVASQRDPVEKSSPEERVVILQPIAMRIPNKYGIYSLSKLRPKKEVSYKEFLSKYADRPRKIRICFDEAPSSDIILQRSGFVTAYGSGLDCWYIVTSNGNKNRSNGK